MIRDPLPFIPWTRQAVNDRAPVTVYLIFADSAVFKKKKTLHLPGSRTGIYRIPPFFEIGVELT